MPRSLAIWAIGFSRNRASSTARRRNSGSFGAGIGTPLRDEHRLSIGVRETEDRSPALPPPEDDLASARLGPDHPHDPDDSGPFTNFGQFGPGQIDKRIVEQDVYWVGCAGAPFFLVDLTDAYRRRIMEFLEDQAVGWWTDKLRVCETEIVSLIAADADEPAIRALLDHVARLMDLGPFTAMEQTLLMRKFRRLDRRAERHQ